MPAPPSPPPPPPHVSGEVSGQIYNGRVIRDDTDDMINHVVCNYFKAADNGESYDLSPELTEEEELAIAILISQEEERSAFPELADALALSVAPPPPPGPPPMQLSCTPLARPPCEAKVEPWDALPELHLGGQWAHHLSLAGLLGHRLRRQDLHRRP
jgi:hypothetical protein